MVHKVTKPVTVPPVPRGSQFSDRVTHEQRVIAEADYFTAVLWAPLGRTVKSPELKSLKEARDYAMKLRDANLDNPRDVLIYAVKQPHDHQALVCSLDAKRNWKEPKK